MVTRREVLQSATGLAALWLTPALARAQTTGGVRVTGPIVGGRRGRPFAAHLGGLDALGYVEEEYFLEGRAERYRPVGVLGPDGRWRVESDGVAPFKTRVLLRRPKDRSKFNGTVVLEWTNVTVGSEIITMGGVSPGLYDSGFAFAAVSCQQIGINGFAKDPQGLRQWDPERYGSLSIPGDSYSYDIFTQAGLALGPSAHRTGVDPLKGLKVRHVIATGASQSAIRLRTYTNAIQPIRHAFHGIVPTLDFGTAMGFDDWLYDTTALQPADAGRLFSTYTRIRDDQATPVVIVNTEFETLRFLPSRQDDNQWLRFWEIAGAAHAAAPGGRYDARVQKRDDVTMQFQNESGSEVMWQPTADAAIDRVHRWINGGAPPSNQARIELTAGEKPEIVRDRYGNARGGVRLPELEVPIARYSGVGTGRAMLAGTTDPFAPELLRKLYPSREAYVRQVETAARAAEQAGVITARRTREYRELALTVPPGL